MPESGIFEILEYSEPFPNCIPKHIQNPAIVKKIGKPSVTLLIQNPGIFNTPHICRTLSKT